jgi:excisionase family DNA binding protein
VSTGRLYELVRLRLIPHVRLGKQVRFDQAAVEEFIRTGGQGLEDEARATVTPLATRRRT